MAYHSFEDLEVWRRACDAAVEVCEVAASIRNSALRDQMMRAAISVPSNIAEGAERNSKPDFLRFLHYSKGSSAELWTQIVLAVRLGHIPQDRGRDLTEQLKQISAMLHGLVQALQK
jgi:four helix bundle protein